VVTPEEARPGKTLMLLHIIVEQKRLFGDNGMISYIYSRCPVLSLFEELPSRGSVTMKKNYDL
jgi:hypothetical protein